MAVLMVIFYRLSLGTLRTKDVQRRAKALTVDGVW
jgi:hypothetical protein